MKHVFVADTNLFFECRRLEELPWSDLAVDPIIIALTKPVLAEIDKHKKSGGRTRKRAIEVSKRVRDMLVTRSSEIVIRESEPRVVLRLMPIVQPAPELADRLDYDINDDRIVGITATLSKDVAYTSVSMLTDDSVAASTAHGLGIPFQLIPDGWKRSPEETTEARRIKELERDIAIYRSQEPILSITNSSGDASTPHVVRRVALALEASQIDGLIEKLVSKHPKVMDFTAPEPKILEGGTEISYEAPAADAIAKYSREAYPGWIGACRAVFENLHRGRLERESRVVLTFSVANGGTRPASRMRVSFEAVGNIALSRDPPASGDAADQASDHEPSLCSTDAKLPEPPIAPTARRIVKRPTSTAFSIGNSSMRTPGSGFSSDEVDRASNGMPRALGSHSEIIRDSRSILEDLQGGGAFKDLLRGALSSSELARMATGTRRIDMSAVEATGIATPTYLEIPKLRMPAIPERRDDEAFYYDAWPKGQDVGRGALTCELFRHQRGEEPFEIGISFIGDEPITGGVRCTVEAENLTKPVTLLIPVSRRVETYDLMPIATELIERCG